MTSFITTNNPDFSYKSGYVTYRRFLLDVCLNKFSNEMSGLVIDLGGKRINKRGSFSPTEQQARTWWYINLDLGTSPNIFADVKTTPLQSAIADCVLCTEVLEHLANPQACVNEIHRIVRNGGLVFASVPFFYPVHADPYDFQRFTEDGLRHLFRDFRTVEIHRMGGYTGVLGLLIELGIQGLNENRFSLKIIRWAMKWVSRLLFRYDLSISGKENDAWKKFTTGYFVRAVR